VTDNSATSDSSALDLPRHEMPVLVRQADLRLLSLLPRTAAALPKDATPDVSVAVGNENSCIRWWVVSAAMGGQIGLGLFQLGRTRTVAHYKFTTRAVRHSALLTFCDAWIDSCAQRSYKQPLIAVQTHE
jgi:hypothetical protein